MVYKALWEELADGGPIHAVDNIIARAPCEEQRINFFFNVI